MSKQETDLEEVTKEQLLVYLKDKNKEIKNFERKVKKLEERYLAVYKENKNIRKSWQILMNSLSKYLSVKPNDEAMLEPDTFKSVADKIYESIDRIMSKQKDDIIEKYKREESSDRFTELKSQIAALQQEIYSKDDRINELQEYIEQHEQHNYDLLLKDLNQLSKTKDDNVEQKIADSEKTNTILKLKQEVKILKDALAKKDRKDKDRHEIDTNGHNDGDDLYNSNLHLEYINKYTQTQDGHWELKHSDGMTPKKENIEKKVDDNEQAKISSHEGIKIYLKELIGKYFDYEGKGAHIEKLLILNAILDVLQFTYEDRIKIERVASQKGKLFKFI